MILDPRSEFPHFILRQTEFRIPSGRSIRDCLLLSLSRVLSLFPSYVRTVVRPKLPLPPPPANYRCIRYPPLLYLPNWPRLCKITVSNILVRSKRVLTSSRQLRKFFQHLLDAKLLLCFRLFIHDDDFSPQLYSISIETRALSQSIHLSFRKGGPLS